MEIKKVACSLGLEVGHRANSRNGWIRNDRPRSVAGTDSERICVDRKIAVSVSPIRDNHSGTAKGDA